MSDSSQKKEPTTLAEVLETVAKKLEVLSESIKNNPEAKNKSLDSKLVKEILLSTLAASGRDDLDEIFVEKVIQSILKSR